MGKWSEPQLAVAKTLVYSALKRHVGVNFYSQASQDLFVLEMLSGKEQGFFLELGAGHPTESSNSFLLESQKGWRGIGIDIDAPLVAAWAESRASSGHAVDATACDFNSLLEQCDAPPQIDYLSVDIEPAESSLLALKKLPHERFRFSVITFEHDRYRFGDAVANESRVFLSERGYQLVVSDVCIFGNAYEDWWVDPEVVPEAAWQPFESSNREFASLWNFVESPW